MHIETLSKLLSINYMIVGTPLALLLLGWELWTLKSRGTRIRLNDSVMSICCGLFSNAVNMFLLPVFVTVLVALSHVYTLFDMSHLSVPQSLLAAFILLLGADFMFYWTHRFMHVWNIAWATHAVHHQSEEMNYTTSFRNSAFQAPSVFLCIAPLVFIGFPPLWVFSVFTFILSYQFWLHTEVIRKLPPWLEYIMSTPSSHRVHHGTNHQYLDRNYGGVFVIWDRLFGTFVPEVEQVRYGVIDPYQSWNAVAANFNVFSSLLRQAKTFSRLRDQFKLWFMPPGWDPAGPKEIPSTEGRAKFDPPFAEDAKRGLFILLILAIVVGSTAVTIPPDGPLWPLVAGLALIEFFLLWALGRKMDGLR